MANTAGSASGTEVVLDTYDPEWDSKWDRIQSYIDSGVKSVTPEIYELGFPVGQRLTHCQYQLWKASVRTLDEYIETQVHPSQFRSHKGRSVAVPDFSSARTVADVDTLLERALSDRELLCDLEKVEGRVWSGDEPFGSADGAKFGRRASREQWQVRRHSDVLQLDVVFIEEWHCGTWHVAAVPFSKHSSAHGLIGAKRVADRFYGSRCRYVPDWVERLGGKVRGPQTVFYTLDLDGLGPKPTLFAFDIEWRENAVGVEDRKFRTGVPVGIWDVITTMHRLGRLCLEQPVPAPRQRPDRHDPWNVLGLDRYGPRTT